MTLISDYVRLLSFALGLLLGIQVPAFVDQYAKRVDAHWREARTNLGEFQLDADRYFNGDMQRLISHYGKDDDPVVRDGGKSVAAIYDRVSLLSNERAALSGSWWRAVYHVAFAHNPALLKETVAQYSYVVMLNLQAVFWGIATGLIAALGGDAARLVLLRLLGVRAGLTGKQAR